jgi:hypothetical protein
MIRVYRAQANDGLRRGPLQQVAARARAARGGGGGAARPAARGTTTPGYIY